MRVSDEERSAAAGLESSFKLRPGLAEVEIVIQIRGSHVGQSLAATRVTLQDLFELGNSVVVLLAVNEIERVGHSWLTAGGLGGRNLLWKFWRRTKTNQKQQKRKPPQDKHAAMRGANKHGR
jgi:hypothetical protein